MAEARTLTWSGPAAHAARPWRYHLTGYLFVGPALVVLGAFLLYPIGYSVWLSLHEWNGYTPRWGPFVGLANYAALARDEVFWKATVNSLVTSAACVSPSTGTRCAALAPVLVVMHCAAQFKGCAALASPG